MSEHNFLEFRAVGMDYVDSAPVRYIVSAEIALPRQLVWNYFADASSWCHWFPHVNKAWYEGEQPYGVGSIRMSDVAGVIHEETMVAWDEPVCWAYAINRATEQLSAAQIEVTEFEESEAGTKIIWTLACEPMEAWNFLSGEENFETFLEKLLNEALGNLARHHAKSS